MKETNFNAENYDQKVDYFFTRLQVLRRHVADLKKQKIESDLKSKSNDPPSLFTLELMFRLKKLLAFVKFMGSGENEEAMSTAMHSEIRIGEFNTEEIVRMMALSQDLLLVEKTKEVEQCIIDAEKLLIDNAQLLLISTIDH